MPAVLHHLTNFFTATFSFSSLDLARPLNLLSILREGRRTRTADALLFLCKILDMTSWQLTTWVGVAGRRGAMTNRFLLDALHPRRYPLCGVGYKRTREHLLSWKAVLPASVKEAKVLVSRQAQETPHSPHSGTW